MKKKNNLENLEYLSKQIESDREKKAVTQVTEKKYYKTHFGPEETDETTLKEL